MEIPPTFDRLKAMALVGQAALENLNLPPSVVHDGHDAVVLRTAFAKIIRWGVQHRNAANLSTRKHSQDRMLYLCDPPVCWCSGKGGNAWVRHRAYVAPTALQKTTPLAEQGQSPPTCASPPLIKWRGRNFNTFQIYPFRTKCVESRTSRRMHCITAGIRGDVCHASPKMPHCCPAPPCAHTHHATAPTCIFHRWR